MFVHVNYLADKALDEQPEDALYWWHINEFPLQPHISGKHVVCGHTPQTDRRFRNLGFATCLDTGCFFGNWLSALDLATGQIWQANQKGQLKISTKPAH
jgi:serine/threonine protein phosphatase 1